MQNKMPEKYATLALDCIELFGKLIPYVIGLFVSVSLEISIINEIADACIKIAVTSISMVVGSIVVYYVKPIIIKQIDIWKKK